ncbi:hypothetical protein T11_11139 [Trichinella zimbabwensis]|uniref:Uncharacterized protein n=1 Tax=Trichinella zimbabwensis TaxID=268475 RepID=A0A0V1I1T6_9BILA|nr:hypothetical protein T11_11139 [Trichinella zimbabwensis]
MDVYDLKLFAWCDKQIPAMTLVTLISDFPGNDGPAVVSGVFRGAQHIIREQYSNAHYIL